MLYRGPKWLKSSFTHEVLVKFLFFVLIFVTPSYGFSHVTNEHRTETIFSENGSISVACEENEKCSLTIKGKIIASQFYHMGDIPPNFEHIDGPIKDIYLMNLYHGDGCPVKYVLIHLAGPEYFYISEPFGNCGNITDSRFEEKGVIFKLPGLAEAQREEKVYFYSLENKKLIELR